MSGSSPQHCRKLFHNCPYLGSIGGCAYHTESSPSSVCSLPQRSIVSLASDGLNPATNERAYLLLDGWNRKGKPKLFICHIVSFYENLLPSLFLLSLSGFLQEHLITVNALSQGTRNCALRGSGKQYVHIRFHCHCSICIAQDINLILDASPQSGKKTKLSLN